MSFEAVGKILVTGATGFVGGAVLRRLHREGYQVIGQGRSSEKCAELAREGLNSICWDIREKPPAIALGQLADVRAIIHAAALSAPFGPKAEFDAVNVAGTKAMLDLAISIKARRFVLISSPSIYFALRDQLNVREDDELPKPFNHYARSKVQAEKLTRAVPQIGPVILRPRGIYGPGDTALLPRLLAAAARRPLPVFRGGIAKIDLTYIDDVVDAVRAALFAGREVNGNRYNISGGEVLKIADIVSRCCHRAGIEPQWRRMPLRPALFAARAAEALSMMKPGSEEPAFTRYGLALFAFEQSLNIERAKRELGWVPKTPFERGLELTFEDVAR